jgi:hypothetical protein
MKRIKSDLHFPISLLFVEKQSIKNLSSSLSFGNQYREGGLKGKLAKCSKFYNLKNLVVQ